MLVAPRKVISSNINNPLQMRSCEMHVEISHKEWQSTEQMHYQFILTGVFIDSDNQTGIITAKINM